MDYIEKASFQTILSSLKNQVHPLLCIPSPSQIKINYQYPSRCQKGNQIEEVAQSDISNGQYNRAKDSRHNPSSKSK